MQEKVEINPSARNNQENNNFLDRETLLQLSRGVFLVRGAKTASISDTNTGNVYSVNESGLEVILGERENSEYWHQLQEMNLVDRPEDIKPAELERKESKLNFVWFEIISDDCNESCAHCYADSMPKSHRKALGLASAEHDESQDKPKLTLDDWYRLIQESYDLGARSCQFIGGEPFLYVGEDRVSRVIDLAQYAKEVGFETVEIFTNGSLVTNQDIERIKELGINIAVSLYSADPKVHDSITNLPNSHKMTTKTLRKLKEASVETRVESVLMEPNQHTVAETKQFIADIGFEPHSPDVLRPKGRGDNPDIQPDDEQLVRYGLMLGPNFYATREQFTKYATSHSCLAGKITITDKGDVLPCIFSRDQIIGNVMEADSLRTIIEGDQTEDVWKTTKDDVLVCQDCEYRHVCFDCRPISQGASGGNGEYKTAPYPRCTYNPYEGEWGNGTWKLDENGQPYYDESLKPIIEQIRSEGVTGNQAESH